MAAYIAVLEHVRRQFGDLEERKTFWEKSTITFLKKPRSYIPANSKPHAFMYWNHLEVISFIWKKPTYAIAQGKKIRFNQSFRIKQNCAELTNLCVFARLKE